MSFEKYEKGHKERICLSYEEFRRIADADVGSSELTKWMVDNGVEFDSNPIRIEIDGEEEFMRTDKKNWGILVDMEDANTLRGGG